MTDATAEFPIAVLKVGRDEDDIDIEYVTLDFGRTMVEQTRNAGWDVRPLNFGWRIMLPDDEVWAYVDLLDRKMLGEMTGVIL